MVGIVLTCRAEVATSESTSQWGEVSCRAWPGRRKFPSIPMPVCSNSKKRGRNSWKGKMNVFTLRSAISACSRLTS